MHSAPSTQTTDKLFIAEGSPTAALSTDRCHELVAHLINQLGSPRRVLLIPPDYTRVDSWAGPLTSMLYEQLSPTADVTLLPALGTHEPMPSSKRHLMFPGIPEHAFREHRWRDDLVRLGEVDADFVETVSQGAVRFPIPIEVNRLLMDYPWDAIISIGQLVPHEVIGIANHVKNVLIGVGGRETIHKSHYLGAVFGMERIMGRIDSPVRAVLQEGMNRFGHTLPIVYLLTVRGFEGDTLVTRGLFAGTGARCYQAGATLCGQCNINRVEQPLPQVVVWLDPEKYHSTWLGNKAIYRTRMAIADGGELVVLAPGVRTFGEDREIDELIRQYGYHGTPRTVEAVARGGDLASNLAAAAHLIHGSSEGRFRITYAPGHLTPSEIQGVGFSYMEPGAALRRYDPDQLQEGWNHLDGEEIYFIRHPGQGLWISPKNDFSTL